MFNIKLIILIIFNIFLLPFYVVFFGLAFCLSFIPIYPTKIAKANLRDRLKINGIQVNYYISIIYMNYLFYFIEVFLFDIFKINCSSYLNNKFNSHNFFEVANKMYPQSQGKGVVFILPHMSNYEKCSIPILESLKKIHLENNLYALAKRSDSKIINTILQWYRDRSGIKGIWTDSNILNNMNRVLKQENICLSLLVDQKPKGGGVFIQFFDKFSIFPTSGLRMCMNHNMVVIYLSGKRIFPGYIKLTMQFGLNPHLSSANDPVLKRAFSNQNLTKAEIHNPASIKKREEHVILEMSVFVSWLEQEIRKNPTQWSWDYKKWSREVVGQVAEIK